MHQTTGRLLIRAVLWVAALLVLVVLVGVARRLLDAPAVTPAAAAGIAWLIGCAGIVGWLGLVVASAYRDRATSRWPSPGHG